MMTSTPRLSPRLIESLFRALGASPAFIDGVVGDLVEEFAERCASEGEPRAQAWFRREALRAVPSAAREGGRLLRWRDGRQLLSHALLAHVIVGAPMLMVGAMMAGVLHALGVPLSMAPVTADSLTWVLRWLPVVILEALALGYTAAWVDARRPLACAATMALCWLTAHTAMFAIEPKEPLWFFLTIPPTIAASVMLGGLARVFHLHRREGGGSTPSGAAT
jgi:hypothetical protein